MVSQKLVASIDTQLSQVKEKLNNDITVLGRFYCSCHRRFLSIFLYSKQITMELSVYNKENV